MCVCVCVCVCVCENYTEFVMEMYIFIQIISHNIIQNCIKKVCFPG